MRKPTEAIERMRCWNGYEVNSWGGVSLDAMMSDAAAILAYLDSIPPDAVPVVWPSYWPKKAIEQAANALDSGEHPHDALRCLRALAAIAPKREKRKVALWKNDCGDLKAIAPDAMTPANGFNGRWTLVGEGEIEG